MQENRQAWKDRAEAEKSWGTRVAERRESFGMTQTKLAEIAKVDRSLISRIEANKVTPRYRTMSAIATALGISTTELFPWDSHPDRRAS